MSDIFISYASADREKAKLLAGALEQKGWSVWWDRNIPPGMTFSKVIKETLDNAKCIVVLWSNESVNSDWVQNEAAEGARRKILVPALIEDVEIPFEFRRIQAAQLIDWDGISEHAEFELLVKSISSNLGEAKVHEKESQEDLFWQKTTDSNTIELYNDYLSQYPNGKYKNNAIEEIKSNLKEVKDQKSKISVKKNNKSIFKRMIFGRKFIIAGVMICVVALLSYYIIIINSNSKPADERYSSSEENDLSEIEALLGITSEKPETLFNLRNTSLKELSRETVRKMLTRYGFYCRDFNRNGTGIDNKYKVQKSGKIIFDAKTKLFWQQSGSQNEMIYSEAVAYIDKLNMEKFVGYDDWRLPTLEEAMSLMELKKQASTLYIDPIFSSTQGWIWTVDKYSTYFIWVANFFSGGCFYESITGKLNVRAVRNGL